MLAERQSNVAALRSMSHDLESVDLDPTQQGDLQTSVDECVARYSAVNDVCVQHRSELDGIELAVDSYRTRLDAFLSWLDLTERSSTMMDAISVDVNSVQQQADQQRVCYRYCFFCYLCPGNFRSTTSCLPVSEKVKLFQLRFFGHLAGSISSRGGPSPCHRCCAATTT